MFARIENGVVMEWPIASITARFPNTSFPEVLNNNSMPEGYVMVGVIAPPAVGATQKAVPGKPIKQGAHWVQSWDVVGIPQEELDERARAVASAVREDRDQRLTDTDWVVIKTLEQQQQPPTEWVKYRQALRDVTSQAGFPNNVVWPDKP